MADRNLYIQGGATNMAGTRRQPFELALSAYSTNASFAALATEQAVITEPAASTSCAVVYMGDFNNLTIKPTGTDADNETHARRIYGVAADVISGVIVGYTRTLLATVTCTNCAVAVSQTINGATANAFYCDTLTVVSYAIDPAGIINTSNAADVPATLTIDTMGFSVIEIQYAINGGSGVAMNDFVRKV